MLIDGFSFDVEMLYIARQKGYTIKEVPVVWINSPASRVDPFKDSLQMLKDVISIKKIHR
jgi:dolichyl-phosphate beta-glucosyltransferase